MKQETPFISKELVEKTKEWLGEEGNKFFHDECYKKHGTVSPVIVDDVNPFPHPVHFREGMQVRNFLRSTGLCNEWDTDDYDNHWSDVIEMAIGVRECEDTSPSSKNIWQALKDTILNG